ncbi:MAG: TIGR02300 family protein [Paracoccus sp. (in: a-proteobacteria)]
MPKEEWGTKRLCPHCGSRFYDLRSDPMTCPACRTEFTLESLAQGRGRSLVSEKTASKDNDQDDDLIDDDLDADDSSDMEDDLLEDDDDNDDVSLDDIADVSGDDED